MGMATLCQSWHHSFCVARAHHWPSVIRITRSLGPLELFGEPLIVPQNGTRQVTNIRINWYRVCLRLRIEINSGTAG